MDTRVVEIKEEIVNIRCTSENNIAKQTELEDDLKAALSVLRESASCAVFDYKLDVSRGPENYNCIAPFSYPKSTLIHQNSKYQLSSINLLVSTF
jgi:hypothetical protein